MSFIHNTLRVEQTRHQKTTPLRYVQAIYQNEVINDALLLSYAKQSYIGFAGLEQQVPILLHLLNSKVIREQMGSFSSKDVYLFKYTKERVIFFKNNVEVGLNKEAIDEINDAVQFFSSYGGTLNKRGEHVLNLKHPKIGPHYGVNLLLGNRLSFTNPQLTTPKSVVDELGSGSFRAHAADQVLATRWDMRPEENGNPFNRQFYLVEAGKVVFYSRDLTNNVKAAETEHKVNHTVITYFTKDDLKITRTIFLLPQIEHLPNAIETQLIEIENLSNNERHLTLCATGMFGSADPRAQMVDVVYQTLINQSQIVTDEANEIIAITPDYYPEYTKRNIRFFTLRDAEGFAENFSYNATTFIGNGTIEKPENIANLGNKFELKGPSFFALDKQFVLQARSKHVFTTFVGIVDATKTKGEEHYALLKDELINLHNYFPTVTDVFAVLERNKEWFDHYKDFLQIETTNPHYDSFVNYNLPFQILYQTFVSRSFAQTQKGYREIGFREIQDIFASMYYFESIGERETIRNLLGNWIINVFELGYANHNFYFTGKEPGMCSDDQIWLVLALKRYLDLTDDYSFLTKLFAVAGSDKKRTLYETLKAIIIYSGKISVGKHGIPLLDKTDWNDTLRIDDDYLDGPEKEKAYYEQLKRDNETFGVPFKSELAESVMNGFLLTIALENMVDISAKLALDDDNKLYIAMKEALVTSLRTNAFINGYYARVLLNRPNNHHNVKYIGAPGDKLSLRDDFDGSIYLNSFSWSILSGVATEEEIASMLPLVEKYLKTSAGFTLCSLHNLRLAGSKEAATEQYFPGDRENGGVFKHATMMLVVSLLKAYRQVKNRGLKKSLMTNALFMLDLTFPFKTLESPAIYKGNPRFCTQYVNPLSQEHIGPILSGTSSWLFLMLVEVLGLSFHTDGFTVNPLYFGKFHINMFTLNIRGTKYQFDLSEMRDDELSKIEVEGVVLTERFIPYQKVKEVSVKLT